MPDPHEQKNSLQPINSSELQAPLPFTRILPYWPEFMAFLSLTLLGILTVDGWRERHQAERNYQVSQDFQYLVSELTVATLLVDYTTTENYDNQAQLLLSAEDTWRMIDDREMIEEQWQEYNHNIAHFVQLASMLKTSRRFIGDAERHFNNNLDTFGAVGEHIVALILSFESRLNESIAQDVRDYIIANEHNLKRISDVGMQWPMLKRHIEFILGNTATVSQLVRTVQALPLPATLQQHTKIKSSDWSEASQHLYFMATLLIVNLFVTTHV